jgi:hypothetical protein
VRPGAVEESRKLKPEIPRVGAFGIPIHDELEMELLLSSVSAGVPFEVGIDPSREAVDPSREAVNSAIQSRRKPIDSPAELRIESIDTSPESRLEPIDAHAQAVDP